MSFLDALILGIVQGLTEFLPVSSSGHLVIAQKVLGITQHDLVFDVAAHLGTLLSIVTIYYGLLRQLLVKGLNPKTFFSGKSQESHLIWMVIAASIPTAVIGLLFKDYFEQLFSDMWSLGICFIITGLLLLLSKVKGGTRFSARDLSSLEGVEKITWPKAVLIGVAQAVAIMPSISRSGTTIVSGLLLGIPASTAAMFSFVISLPAIAGAALLELRHIDMDMARFEILGIGFIASYFSGLIGLWAILQSVRKGRLEIFTAYLVAIGIYILVAWT